jgi:trk system potassium uptake protein TrkA
MLESIVTPKDVISQQIARYVRAMDNSKDSSMETLYRLAGGKVEALEFHVNEDSKCIGIPLKELPLREDVIIGAIIHESRTIIPNGSSVIQPGDHVILITDAGKVKVLDAALKEVAG